MLFTHNDRISEDSTLSHMLVDWGQWIDHDLVLTPQSPSTAAFKTVADCSHSCSRDSPCFPIQVHFITLITHNPELLTQQVRFVVVSNTFVKSETFPPRSHRLTLGTVSRAACLSSAPLPAVGQEFRLTASGSS